MSPEKHGDLWSSLIGDEIPDFSQLFTIWNTVTWVKTHLPVIHAHFLEDRAILVLDRKEF